MIKTKSEIEAFSAGMNEAARTCNQLSLLHSDPTCKRVAENCEENIKKHRDTIIPLLMEQLEKGEL